MKSKNTKGLQLIVSHELQSVFTAFATSALLRHSGMGIKLCMSPDSGILAVPRLPKASCKYAPQ